MKLTEKQLKEAAQDFIDVMKLTDGPEGNKVPLVLTPGMTSEEYIALITKVISWIEPGDEFKKETLKVIDALKDPIEEEEKAEEVVQEDIVDPPALTLEQEIEKCERLKELKEIALAEPQFKAIRGKLSSFKTVDDLKEEMMWLFVASKVPKKPAKEQKLPLEDSQEVVAKKLHKKLEETPINAKAAKNYSKEEIEALPDEKKLVGRGVMATNDIITIKPFNCLFDIDEKVLVAVKDSIEKNGYDPAFPVILWEDVMIDGHTRLEAAEQLGIKEIPVLQKEFKDEAEALEYAIHNQRDRRNLSDAELLRCVAAVDTPMTKQEAGKKGKEVSSGKLEIKKPKVESHKETAKKLNISESKVTDARTVLGDEDAVKAVESGKKTISKAAKEVREKKRVEKPTKVKEVKKTRIEAVCQVIKDYANSEKMLIEDIVAEADDVFVEFGGKRDENAISKDTEIVISVLVALGFVTREDSKTITIGDL